MQRCSHCYGQYRLVALRKYRLLEILVEEEIGSGSSQRSLAQPEMTPLSLSRFWTFAAVGYSESVISLPSEMTSASLLRLIKFHLVFKFASTLLSWLCSGAQSVSSLRKIVIVLQAIEHSLYVLVALMISHGATFRREKLALFLLLRCEFPVFCSSLPEKAGHDLARSISIF